MFNFECFAFTLLITVTTSFAISGSLPALYNENTMDPGVKGHSNKVNSDSSQIEKQQGNWKKSNPSSTESTIEKGQKEQIENEILSDEGINSIFENEEEEVISSWKKPKDANKYEKMENMIIKQIKKIPEAIQKDLKYLLIENKSTKKRISNGVKTITSESGKYKDKFISEGVSRVNPEDWKYNETLINNVVSTVNPEDGKYNETLINNGVSTVNPEDGKYENELISEGVSTITPANGRFKDQFLNDGVSTIAPSEKKYKSESSSEEISSILSVDGKFINESMDDGGSPDISNKTVSSEINSTDSTDVAQLKFQQNKNSIIATAPPKTNNLTISSKLFILSEKFKRRINTLTTPLSRASDRPLNLHSTSLRKSATTSSSASKLYLKRIKENIFSSPHDSKLKASKSSSSSEHISLHGISLKNFSVAPSANYAPKNKNHNLKTSNYSEFINILKDEKDSTTDLSLSLDYQNETNISDSNTTVGSDTVTEPTAEPIKSNETSDQNLEPTQNLTLTPSTLTEISTSLLSITTKESNSTTSRNYINSTSNFSVNVENVTKNQTHSNFSKSSEQTATYSSRSSSRITQTLSNLLSSSNFVSFSPKGSSTISKTRVPSERRVEIPEKEKIDIYWICPPADGSLTNKDTEYEWYKVQPETGSYSHPLPKVKDLTTGNFILQIKGISNNHGGRYLCVSRDSSPFVTPKMYFYQIVVLNSRWINIGSTSTAVLYFNQKTVINCPFGDIIKNKVPINDGCCSSRISIIDVTVSSLVDLYQCSDSNKTTVKFPSISSSTNCSLALNGCGSPFTPLCNTTDWNCPRAPETNEIDRCQFKKNNYGSISKSPKRCPGSIYIRFYYNIAKEKCFPFETDICGEDYFTFSTLTECDETCSKIPSSIEKCFYPRNLEESHLCAAKNMTGKYMAYFDIETGECKWFYHCRQFNLTKNVFESISTCNLICLHHRKLILIESIKACRYENFSESSAFLWSFNKQTGNCEISTSLGRKRLKFSSRNNCEKVCKFYGSKEICDSRPENGQCQPSRMKWHFHMLTKRCVKILDGGCGNSLNRFNSKSLCERICMKFIDQQLPDLTTPSTRFTITSTDYNSTSTKSQMITTLTVQESTSQKNQKMHSSTKSVDVSQLWIQFNASSRELDFEPCKKDSISNSCEFGLNRQKFDTYRYTFHWRTATCDQTLFSGCRSGENLFDDSNDCKAACEYRWHATLKYPDCQNPLNVNCMASTTVGNVVNLQRYFYQSSTKECVPFTSVNNSKCLNQYFTSKEKCQHICKPDPPTELLLQNRCFGKVVISKSSCVEDQKVNRWFYMQSIDQCLEYKTCPVNYPGNTFSMKEECDNTCRASNITTVCDLPMDPGVGNRMKSKYFYNRLRGKCQLFLYGGSLGNLNRFDTKIECQKFCIVTMENTEELKVSSLIAGDYHYKKFKGTKSSKIWLKENIDKEYCYDSHKYGDCRNYRHEVFIEKYSYDSYSKRCEAYMFSGCGAISRNSFDSISICDKMCTERITKTVSSYCSPLDSKCPESTWAFWAYSSERGVCEQFKSCNKVSSDQLKFKNESHCSEFCSPILPMKKDLFDICHLPPKVSKNCTIQSERWFYNRLTESCYSAYSCKQYGNNFPSLNSCRAACRPNSLKDICQLPMDKGPCEDNETLNYYFDWSSHTCKLFAYGGCLGNRNRFRTHQECQSVCPSKNPCNIKLEDQTKCGPLNLNPVSNIYHYDTLLGKCRHIDNFTCGDHTKYFESVDECIEYCVVPMEYQLISFKDTEDSSELRQPVCGELLRFNTYPVCTKKDEWLPRFYYSQEQGHCAFFYYNGCDGIEDKGNRFTTAIKCMTKCLEYSATTAKSYTNRQTSEVPFVTSPSLIKRSQDPSNYITLEGPVKSGLCPDSNYQCLQVQENSINCMSDVDCQYSWKCCPCEMSFSILSRCVEPLNCMTSKYGCCADGITFASDNFHSNCKKIRPAIVNLLPEIIDNISGNDIFLNCQVSGDPKPSINWIYLENNSLILNPRSVDLDLVQPFWSGQIKIPEFNNFLGLWMCRVNSEMGIDEKEVYISRSKFKHPFLREYLFTSTDKLSINVTVDHRVTLHCPIYGIPRPTITWFFNKIMINESLWSLSIFGRHLIIENSNHLHSGIWSCVANNKYGSVSHKIRLQVLEAIQIFPPPMGTTIKTNPGHQVILFCNVQVEGYHSIFWYWEMGANKTLVNSTLEFESRILKVSEFRNQFNGSYVCEADNKVSHAILKYKIVPYNKDEISLNPSGTHFIGTTVTLKCPLKLSEATGSVIWKKDGILLGIKSIELKLDLKSKSDSGFYTCQQNNRNYMIYLYLFDLPPNR